MPLLAILSLIGQGIAMAAKGVQSYQGAQNKKKQQAYDDEVYAKQKKEARQNAIARALDFDKSKSMMPYMQPKPPGMIDPIGAQIIEGVGNSVAGLGRYSQPEAVSKVASAGYDPTSTPWAEGSQSSPWNFDNTDAFGALNLKKQRNLYA